MVYLAKEKIVLNFDGKVVDADSPEASHVLALAGDVVSDEDVERLHIKGKMKDVSEDKVEDAQTAIAEKIATIEADVSAEG